MVTNWITTVERLLKKEGDSMQRFLVADDDLCNVDTEAKRKRET